MPDTVDIEQQVARMFAAEVADHRMIVRLDQGIYRHLVFEQREHSWYGRFELISTPGTLTFVGDRGAHTFQRMRDMFQFFRCNPDRPHRINPSYWAEKLPDSGRSVQVYSETILRRLVDEHRQEAISRRDAIQEKFDDENARQLEEWREDLRAEGIEDGDPEYYRAPEPERAEDWPELIKARKLVGDATEQIEDYDADGLLGYEDGARRLLAELEHLGLVSDTWEWDLRDWDFHFLWCLNAIAWGIQQYDLAVRSGLHVKRTGPIAWDTPLPTVAPTKPDPATKPATPEKAAPIKAIVTLSPVGVL